MLFMGGIHLGGSRHFALHGWAAGRWRSLGQVRPRWGSSRFPWAGLTELGYVPCLSGLAH